MKALLIVTLALAAHPLAAQTDTVQVNPRARLFVASRCADCHSLLALKVKAASDVGPDLTTAYVDVPARYGVKLEQFFDHPVGVMRVIFGGQVQLQRAESDSLVRLFRDLYAEHLARLDSLTRRARAVDGGPRSSEPHR
jgi:hypothetical protein